MTWCRWLCAKTGVIGRGPFQTRTPGPAVGVGTGQPGWPRPQRGRWPRPAPGAPRAAARRAPSSRQVGSCRPTGSWRRASRADRAVGAPVPGGPARERDRCCSPCQPRSGRAPVGGAVADEEPVTVLLVAHAGLPATDKDEPLVAVSVKSRGSGHCGFGRQSFGTVKTSSCCHRCRLASPRSRSPRNTICILRSAVIPHRHRGETTTRDQERILWG